MLTQANLPGKVFYLFIATILFSLSSFAQLVDPFKIYYQTNQRGGIKFVSNSATTCQGGCAAQTEVPPAGTGKNNDFFNDFIDIDSDPTTFMSSSDSLNLPSCSEILWAGLFWGGETFNTSPYYANRDNIRIKINNGNYLSFFADSILDNNLTFVSYHCFKDITNLVQIAGNNARITVANVAARSGVGNRFGGWTIAVVYKNNALPLRNLTVFSGLSHVINSNTTDVTLSGILTPPSGPVTFEMGHMSFDGDRDYIADSLLFKGGSNFVPISDASHAVDNVFNSCLSYNGVLSPYTIPNHSNTLGFDAAIFVPNNTTKNYIGNNATSATLRFRTGVEGYLTQLVTMAIDVYEPYMQSVVRINDMNGGTMNPGDTLEYTVVGYNKGNDVSTNSYIRDSVEWNQSFVPGSIKITYGPNSGPLTDTNGDDQGEYLSASRVVRVRIGTGANSSTGGTVINSSGGTDSTVVKFKTVVSNNCVALSCDNIINNRAWIYGQGQISSNYQKNGSSSGLRDANNCPLGTVTSYVIQTAGCSNPADILGATSCPGTVFASQFPSLATYTFYANQSFTSPITVVGAAGTYYALYKAYNGCTDTVTIVISAISCDTDGDGIPDNVDIDDDNDGITDYVEVCGIGATSFSCVGGDPNGDADNDGILNFADPNFCTLNAKGVCASMDKDGDGIINELDLDSDNDGITDVTEAGGSDPDNNGQIGTGTGSGIADSNNDGLANLVDPANGGTPLNPTNSDSDNFPNYLDIDSDGDGIVDNVEAQTTTSYILPTAADTDKDGILDVYDNITGFGGAGINPANTDGADVPDYIDTDSDNDNYTDFVEGNDFNGDNIMDVVPSGSDSDGDGLDNSYDNIVSSSNPIVNISNNDGPPTGKFPNVDAGTAELDWRDPFDTDGDGVPNNIDIDDDNDGITDVNENLTAGGTNKDTDNDGTPDLIDLDSDNDGIGDVIEANGTDPDNDGKIGTGPGTDSDGDGLLDIIDNVSPTGLAVVNTDGDSKPDFQDLDSDNDAISDVIESGGADGNNDGIIGSGTSVDSDNDGLLDVVDTNTGGVLTNNPPDTDGDNIDDYRDLDSDNDSMGDIYESGNGSMDANNDGVADGGDADNDGIKDPADNNDTVFGFFASVAPKNSDGDAVADYRDLDSDNDGINDIVESGNNSMDTNNDGVVDGADSDNDGIRDLADGNTGVFGVFTDTIGDDTDNDGTPDYLDLDSDNDAIYDVDDNGTISLDANNDGMVDGADTDNDGIIDSVDSMPTVFGGSHTVLDTDGDGTPDYNDLDSDNDQLPDATEAQDGDLTTNPPDTDGDGKPDFQDLDSDGDYIPDIVEQLKDDNNNDVPDYIDPNKEIIVPEGFSPNGDGINDYFQLKGIETFPRNEVTIFNRWGNVVFQGQRYDNRNTFWDGTNHGQMSTGDGYVPEGTYFYVIFFRKVEGGELFKMSGYVYMNRNGER